MFVGVSGGRGAGRTKQHRRYSSSHTCRPTTAGDGFKLGTLSRRPKKSDGFVHSCQALVKNKLEKVMVGLKVRVTEATAPRLPPGRSPLD